MEKFNLLTLHEIISQQGAILANDNKPSSQPTSLILKKTPDKLPTLPELLRQTQREIVTEEIVTSISHEHIQFPVNNTPLKQEQPIEPVQENNLTQVQSLTSKPLSKIFGVLQNDILKVVWEQALLQHYKSKILGK